MRIPMSISPLRSRPTARSPSTLFMVSASLGDMNQIPPPPPSSTPPPIYQLVQEPKKGMSSGMRILFILLAVGFFGSFMMNVSMSAALFGEPADVKKGIDQFPDFKETWSYGTGGEKIAHITLQGPIMRQGESGLFGSSVDPIESVIQQVRAAQNDDGIKGILFEVNSPGGAITPSDEIYHQLKLFREASPDHFVVIFMRDVAASGGYYVAMASDWIIAEPTTIVGSIGVIVQAFNFKGLADKYGVRATTIASGDNKALLNPFEEPNADHVAIFQTLVDDMYDNFVSIVAEGRDLDVEVVKPLADGRIFTAKEAKRLTLIDDIGYWDDAIAKVVELAGGESIKVIRYESNTSVLESLLGVKAPALDIEATVDSLRTPRLEYRWRP